MSTQNPLIIYHRGRHGSDIRVKENTLRAFRRAVKEGALMVEFDVWDGLRVTHDPNPGFDVPTLRDVLSTLGGRCAVNIEIKSPKAARQVMELLSFTLSPDREGWTPEKIVVSSFHHKTAIVVKQQFPELRVGIINGGILEPVYIDWLARQGINNLHIEWPNIYMDIEDGYRMRSAAALNNMEIWAWTVNTKEVFDVVENYGVKAVFTDKPELFR